MLLNEGKCHAIVYHRDTYRRTGRGKSGFELHYDPEQCKRKATVGNYCTQHAALRRARGQGVSGEGEQL